MVVELHMENGLKMEISSQTGNQYSIWKKQSVISHRIGTL